MAKAKETKVKEVKVPKPLSTIKAIQEICEKSIEDVLFEPLTNVTPTGLDILDAHLGGGILDGCMFQLVSKTGVGKTTLLTQILAHVQKSEGSNPICLFADAENGVTKKRLEQLGMDTENVMFITAGLTIEKLFDTIDTIIKYKIDKKITEKSYVVWDSIALTPTEKELIAERADSVIGVKAKTLQFFLTKNLAMCARHNVTLLCVNQLRDKIDMGIVKSANSVKWLGDETIPGGRAVVFNSSQLMMLKHDGDLKEESYGFNGTRIAAKLIKNRMFAPNITFKLAFSFTEGFSNFWSNYMLLTDLKIIKAGGWNKFAPEACGGDAAMEKISWRTKDVKNWYDDVKNGKEFTMRDGKKSPIDMVLPFVNAFDKLSADAIQEHVVDKHDGVVVANDEEQTDAISGKTAEGKKKEGNAKVEKMAETLSQSASVEQKVDKEAIDLDEDDDDVL